MDVPTRPSPTAWFLSHYDDAVSQIASFLEADGISLDGKCVADIGCGEGTIALGLSHRFQIPDFRAYDLRPVNRAALSEVAGAAGCRNDVPETLQFYASDGETIPVPDNYFDVIVSWSAFEHVRNPVALMHEIARVLSIDGVFFLQILPLFSSELGGHLWLSSAGEPFAHMRRSPGDISRTIAGEEGTYPGFTAMDEWDSLNRMTLDDLQRALLNSGLIPTKVELLTQTTHLTRDLMRYRLSDLLIGGVKLLATKSC